MKNNNERVFLGNKIRAVWDTNDNKWWYSAFDIVLSITNSINPRIYWNALKRRHSELNTYCRQLKIYAEDGKQYNSDVIDEAGIKRLRFIIRFPDNENYEEWITTSFKSIKEQAKEKAYQLYKNDLLSDFEVGKLISLKKIHSFLFESLIDNAGTTRVDGNINDELEFSIDDMLMDILIDIVFIPDDSFENIVSKFIQMTNVKPFDKCNGPAIRLWFDLIMRNKLYQCIDWTKIDKVTYNEAILKSSYDDKDLINILQNALSDRADSKDLFINGINASFDLED